MNQLDLTATKSIQQTSYQEKILKNGDYFADLIQDIHSAKETIDIEVYIFNDDELGRKIISVLIAASNRGVKIRLLVDGVGSMWINKSILKNLQNAKIDIRIYHPFPWNISHWSDKDPSSFLNKIFHLLLRMNKRNHRKVCMIDKHIVYVSSTNIAQCHLVTAEGGDNWRDTSVRITGCHPGQIQYAFDRAWETAAHRRFHDPFYAVDLNPIYRLNYAWRLRRRLTKNLLNRIGRARHRIWVTNAYFVPNYFLLRKLIRAADNGVDVKILLSHKSDVIGMKQVATTFYTFLLKKGIKIYEYMPSILHAKIIIIDDWICVGSSNLNNRSFIHDLEIDVNLRTESAKAKIEQHFLEDLTQAREIDLEDLRKQPLFQKIFARMMLFIKYFL